MKFRLSTIVVLVIVVFSCRQGSGAGQNLVQRQANMTKIGVAFHEYVRGTDDQTAYSRADGGNDKIPEKTKLGLSWRVHLLPHMDNRARELFKRFDLDEPWDGPNNSKLIPEMPDAFRSAGATKSGETCFHVLLGPSDPKHRKQFIFNDRSMEGERLRQGMVRQPASTWMAGVTDGTSNTIIVVEAGPQTAQPWTKPGGLLVDLEHPMAALSKKDDDLLVLMGDGKVRNLSLKKVDDALFLAMLTRSGGEDLKNPPPITLSKPQDSTPKSEIPSRSVAGSSVKPSSFAPPQASPANSEKDAVLNNPQNATVIELDDEVLDAVIGGEGKKWCLFLRKSKRIAIFDAAVGKLTGSIPIRFKSIIMAAGADKLLIADTYDGTIERYDLGTFAKEATGSLPKEGTTRMLCLGAASSGPLILSVSKDSDPLGSVQLMSLDIKTLKAKPLVFTEKQPRTILNREAVHFRASADGRVIGYWDSDSGEVTSLVFSKSGVLARFLQDGGANVVPSPDGTLLTRNGVYSPELVPVRTNPPALLIPAQRGTSYVKIVSPGNLRESKPARVVFFSNPEQKTGVHLAEIFVSTGGDQGNLEDFTEDKRFLFCPDEKILGWIPRTNNKLALFKADPQSPSNRPDNNEPLTVTSKPPVIEPGKEFRYAIVVDPNPGDLAFRIKFGPPGMSIADDGTVTWSVPLNWGGSAPAGITISDRYGQQIEHIIPLNNPVKISSRPGSGNPSAAVQPSRPGEQPATAPIAVKPETISVSEVADDIADAAIGGEGTKWCLLLRRSKRVAIFDAAHGKIAGYIPVDARLIAAGADKLLVVNSDARTIDRYNLGTLAKEASGSLPKDVSIVKMCLGSASSGPLIVGVMDDTPKGEVFKLMSIDIMTLKPTPIVTVDPKDKPAFNPNVAHLRASPDGRIIGSWSTSSGLVSIAFTQKRAIFRQVNESVGCVVPNADGFLLTASGIYSSELKPIRNEPAALRIPAQRGGSYLKIVSQLPDVGPKALPTKVVYFANTDEETGLYLRDISFSIGKVTAQLSDFTPDKRFLFCPNEKVLGWIPPSNDKLLLFKADPQSPSNLPERKPLVVTSKPPAVERGMEFKYSMTVEPNAGDLKFRMEFGPADMKVSEDGTVTWNVPPKWIGRPDAAISISDGYGQTITHNISLSVPLSSSPPVPLRGNPSPKKNVPGKKTSQ